MAAFLIDVTIDLFCICTCLISCLRLLRKGAVELEFVGGQVRTDAKDSSDSVIDGEDRFLFNGCSAAVALVAAFLFGLVGGYAITIDVNGSSIGGAKSTMSAVGGCGGAVMTVLLGFVGMRTLSALVTFE